MLGGSGVRLVESNTQLVKVSMSSATKFLRLRVIKYDDLRSGSKFHEISHERSIREIGAGDISVDYIYMATPYFHVGKGGF